MTEEFELPTFEALVAGTLALMTCYAQAAQAEVDPSGRLAANRRIAENLALLQARPETSATLRRLLDRLAANWRQMARCTEQSASPRPAAAPDRPRGLLH